MRWTILVLVILTGQAVQAQLVNGGFEDTVAATAAPNAHWSLRGELLPKGWGYNHLYGGPVGLVPEAYTGKYALSLAKGENPPHFFQGPFPAKAGDCLEVTAWVKGGDLQIMFYEYGAEMKWLRTTPLLTTIHGTDQWSQGGGYYTVTDPQVTHMALVFSTDSAEGILVDDVSVRPVPVPTGEGPELRLETQSFRLTLDGQGRARAFFDKTLQEERLLGVGLPFMTASIANWQLPCTAVRRVGKDLEVSFGDKAKAVVECQEQPHFLVLRLKSWEPQDMQSLTLLDLSIKKLATVGGSLGASYDDRGAVGMLALHYAGTQSVGAAGEALRMRCLFPGRRGLDKAGVALYACPRERLEKTVEEVQMACGLPSPKINGVWGKVSPFIRRSYFFIHDLSEANVEEVIAWGKRGRFAYIQILEDAWSHGGGTYAINERNFPHGRDGLKAVVEKLHRAGFKVGLHFLAAGMRGTDPLVSPVPNDGLAVDVTLPLAAAIDEKATFLPTATPPVGFPKEDGGYEGSGTVLRVGDEIIHYRTVKLDPPYGFVDCMRGALKSQATAHAAGTPAKHLMKSYGLFLIDADSPLMEQVAGNVAQTFRYCGLDGMYFDGSERLQGDHSYYNARIQMAYAQASGQPNLICQGSSFSPYTWHLVSRMASADGYKDIKYYLDERSPSFISWYDANLMPIDIGWYGMNPNIRPDDIEYVMSRSVGFRATVSISTGLQALHTTPQSGEMMDIVARWEELRLSGRVTDKMRERLREKGKEYTLVVKGTEMTLVPQEPTPWATVPAEAGGPTQVEVASRRAAPAEWELQVECGNSVAPGEEYTTAMPLELFEAEPPGDSKPLDTNMFNPTTHGSRATSQGVTQEVSLVTDDVKEGKSACRFRATSTRPDKGGWATFGRAFDPPLALQDYERLGLWVKGDGQGALLKVQLWDAAGNPQDQYVAMDFTGWRFLELPKPNPPLLDYSRLTRLQFYYNGMPAQATCDILLDGLKVMSGPSGLNRPRVRVGDQTLTFPVRLTPGDRIICRSATDCWLYQGGAEAVPLKMEGALPPLEAKLVVTAPEQSHAVRLRAMVRWPEAGLKVPAAR